MAHKTTVQIKDFLEKNSYRLDGSVQFLGDEPNTYQKSWESASVRMCLFATWVYQQAAGNQAIPLVYKTINEFREDFLCDRFYFYETPRDLASFEKEGIPVFGIESKRQLRDFDVVGTSISYSVLTINFVKMLMMSDIPPTWEDRQTSDGKWHAGRNKDPEKWPFVLVGGQVYGAPEVVANVVDAVFCGEVEDEEDNPGLGAVLARIDTMKKSDRWNKDRVSCYADLAREFNFLYFPMFTDVHYGYEDRPSVAKVCEQYAQEVKPSKQVIGISTNIEGLKAPFVKRFVKDMNAVEGLTNPPLLYVDPGMGSGDVEVGRGCPAWCGFCALTYRQKPYRQRSVKYVTDFAKELHQNTGGIHIAPFSPDFPMYTEKKALINSLLTNVTDDIDASSMRVDDFIADSKYITLQAYAGMDTVTLGVEGNSQRMRDLVGKGAADEDVKEAVARGIQAGIRKFKLYMIAALPGEDDGDINKSLILAKQIADIRDTMNAKVQIQFSWTPMLIEGNTPFQWFAPTPSNYALGEIWEKFRELKILFKLGGKAQRDKALYFQLSQRASREVGMAMIEAVAEMGSGAWGGAPKGLYEALEARLYARGFLNGIADCYDERQKHDLFGWEMVDQGINTELLWVTYQQMLEFLEHTDSETYDEGLTDDYHGNEWIERCDTKCMGKAQPVTAKVLTPAGFVELGSLQVGDSVVDPQGEASKVVGVYPQGNLQAYRVSFSDGTSTLASDDHLWAASYQGTSGRVEKVLTTGEVRDMLGSKKHPAVVPADRLYVADLGDDAGVTVDPYLLGLLLGDCSMTKDHTMAWGSQDDQLTQSVRERLPEGVELRQMSDKPNNFKEWAITVGNIAGRGRNKNPLLAQLTALGVHGLTSPFRRIPESYLSATAQTRLAVLQGLMDTDGGRDCLPVACSFTSASKQLRDDVAWLARSLGFPVSCVSKRVRKPGASERTEYFRAYIGERPWLPRLFRLERKLPLLPEKLGKTYNRRFVSIEPEGLLQPHQCIKVSAQSSLYVTDDFIPTHNTCGVCDAKDLKLRRSYIQGAMNELDVDLSDVQVIDQKSQVIRVRAKVFKSAEKRFVMNEHFRYALRRAAGRAGVPHAKRTFKFATDNIRWKDWTCGADFVEFALTKKVSLSQMQHYIEQMNAELQKDGATLQIEDFTLLPSNADTLRQDIGLSLYEMEMDVPKAAAQAAIERFESSDYVKLIMKEQTRQSGMIVIEVNAKDHVDDLWLVKDGTRLLMRALVRGKPSPYQVYAALFEKKSWIEAAQHPAVRVEVFVEGDANAMNFFTPSCEQCGKTIPVNMLDKPFSQTHCPRCGDEVAGRAVMKEAV